MDAIGRFLILGVKISDFCLQYFLIYAGKYSELKNQSEPGMENLSTSKMFLSALVYGKFCEFVYVVDIQLFHDFPAVCMDSLYAQGEMVVSNLLYGFTLY